MISDNIWNLVN